MRNVPELRFDGFDGEWEEKKLSKIAKFSKGKGYSKNDLSNAKYPIYLYGQMYTNYKSQINEIETYTDSIKVNSILSKGNEVLIPSSGETAEDLARASHMNISNVLLGGDLNIIEPIDGVNSHFLALELSNGSVKRSLSKKAQGKSVVHLYNSDIKNQKINYTKFEEQEKIGDLFRKLDDLIEIQEDKVSKIEDFKKSMLQKMFPKKDELVPEFRFDGFDGEWKVNKISDISNQFDRLRKPVKESLRIKGNYPYYGAAGIQDYVDNYIFDGEYVLIAEDGASDILNYPVNYVNEKFWVNNHAHIIQSKEGYKTLFLSYSLKQIDFNPYLVGGTRKKLNASSLERIKVKIPTLEEQAKIGQFFKNLDTQIENEERLLESYKMMKKSLLQKMFV